MKLNVCFLEAERRGSGKHEAESHDRLIQRIEIDVVRIRIPRPSFALPSCLLRAKHRDFSALSKSSTAPWTTSRSLCRGCRRRRRPFLSSTIATRVRRIRRKDQQVCPPFFFCGGMKGLKRCSDVSRALSVFLCLLTWDAPLVARAWYYKRFGVLLNNIMLIGHYGGILLLPIIYVPKKQLKSNYL